MPSGAVQSLCVLRNTRKLIDPLLWCRREVEFSPLVQPHIGRHEGCERER